MCPVERLRPPFVASAGHGYGENRAFPGFYPPVAGGGFTKNYALACFDRSDPGNPLKIRPRR